MTGLKVYGIIATVVAVLALWRWRANVALLRTSVGARVSLREALQERTVEMDRLAHKYDKLQADLEVARDALAAIRAGRSDAARKAWETRRMQKANEQPTRTEVPVDPRPSVMDWLTPEAPRV